MWVTEGEDLGITFFIGELGGKDLIHSGMAIIDI
jgi:hypothetical protein